MLTTYSELLEKYNPNISIPELILPEIFDEPTTTVGNDEIQMVLVIDGQQNINKIFVVSLNEETNGDLQDVVIKGIFAGLNWSTDEVNQAIEQTKNTHESVVVTNEQGIIATIDFQQEEGNEQSFITVLLTKETIA